MYLVANPKHDRRSSEMLALVSAAASPLIANYFCVYLLQSLCRKKDLKGVGKGLPWWKLASWWLFPKRFPAFGPPATGLHRKNLKEMGCNTSLHRHGSFPAQFRLFLCGPPATSLLALWLLSAHPFRSFFHRLPGICPRTFRSLQTADWEPLS